MRKHEAKKENPHERVLGQARETAKSLDILELIDEIPDAPDESRVEIPFPYGGHAPDPYGWRPKEWESRDDA